MNSESIWKIRYFVYIAKLSLSSPKAFGKILFQMSSPMVNCSKSPMEKMTLFENIKTWHIFHLDVISQREESINYSNRLPLPQHVAENSAEHLTMSCIFSHLLCSFCSFCWTIELNKLIKYAVLYQSRMKRNIVLKEN